ncbi:MAG: DUF1385 domain-containing protein [Desulfovibrionaceae bacterium]|nr:DUF1385 domain-containing protein [Desulfovibrionaceae bacterium]
MNVIRSLFLAAGQTVGGQAVIEGVMMRCLDRLAIAVRKPGGEIKVEVRPWFTLGTWKILKKPFVRGFPVLLETLVNGIKALNYSAQEAVEDQDPEKAGKAGSDRGLTGLHLALTLGLAVGAALLLFVVLPHFFSVLMHWSGAAGGLDTLSFHAWDGLFRIMVFVGYILAISLVPDIKRVFQYHGAEHKVIWAFENGGELSPAGSRAQSRLHPRCGTAFLLFVLAVSIVSFALLVPALLTLYSPQSFVLKHAFILAVKLLLMAPISALSYEIIKLAGRFHRNVLCRVLCWPGLFMQLLTTKEPDDGQLEVAIAALKCAVSED